MRDLAELHLHQLELPEGPYRHIAAGPALPWAEFYKLLDRLIGYRLARVRVPGAILRGSGIVGDWIKHVWDFEYPLTRDAMEFATQWPGIDSSRTTAELGIDFRSPVDTYTDALRWLVRAGHIEARQIGRLTDA